jgi:hypothetical protein
MLKDRQQKAVENKLWYRETATDLSARKWDVSRTLICLSLVKLKTAMLTENTQKKMK